jgi:hypothetical protein
MDNKKLAGELVKLAKDLTAKPEDPNYDALFYSQKAWREMREDVGDGWRNHSSTLLKILKKLENSRDYLKLWEQVDDAVSNMNVQKNKANKAIFELVQELKEP